MSDFGSPVSGAKYVGWTADVLVVPNATAHTKGAWYPLGTMERTGLLTISANYAQSYATHRINLIDLSIGNSGAEQIILNNLMIAQSAIGSNSAVSHASEIVLPITLPTGTIVNAKCQSTYASNSGQYLSLSSSDIPNSWTGSVIDTYGATTASSAGTTMTANAAAYTYGSYSEISASCNRMECFFVAVAPRTNQSLWANQEGRWELALGASGQEKLIASGYCAANQATGLTNPQWFGPYYQQISSGQRLSARLKRERVTTQRELDIIVYGVR